jgi:methyl-accepting chemotaxis protein
MTIERQSRLNYAGITPSVSQALRTFWPVVEKSLPEILDGFYRLASSEPALAAMVGSQTARLKSAQGTHWQRLFSGAFDDAYFQSVRTIGLTHNRIGLEPRWYIGGYSFVTAELMTLAVRYFGPFKRKQLAATVQAITRAVMLDMDLAISTYQESMLEERQKRQSGLESAISGFDTTVQNLIGALGQARANLGSTSVEIESTADAMTNQASAVANASQVAATNVQTIAAATEELSASISEMLTRDAVAGTEQANGSIVALAESAHQIGSIVEMINSIASQTKLLALNATIEAARAGESGKGFSVVAAEVKTLANQTERATEDIGRQIASIRTATETAVQSVQSIGGMVTELNQVASAIAAAIEEQTAATREIAGNVQRAADATIEVSAKIESVSAAAGVTQGAVGSLKSANVQLETQTDALRSEVGSFFNAVRAA